MLEKYRKNIELLKQAVETDAVIRPIAKHRKPDGSLDIEGNLLLWNKALEPFEKTRLWEQGTPGFDDRDPLQEEPYFVFVPAPDEEKCRGATAQTVARGRTFSQYLYRKLMSS